jgi:hypothetical protein
MIKKVSCSRRSYQIYLRYPFCNRKCSLTAADAHADAEVAGGDAVGFVEGGGEDAGAGAAEGVS